MENYFFTVRQIENGAFNDDIGTASYLVVPDTDNDLSPTHITDADTWLNKIITAAEEDILIYVHGYNNTGIDVVKAHKAVKQGLANQLMPDGSPCFKGQLITFDWPSGNNALMYLPDRHKAKITALELVNGGIKLLSARQNNNCKINIHLLAHSTGAYVVREAFDDADDHTNSINPAWIVNQMMFIAGDISSNSMNEPGKCDSIYNHTIRLTNYFNPFDTVLAMSNLKRLGFENRAGRVGLPPGAPSKCVDVNCGPYFRQIPTAGKPDFYSHGWYFDNTNNSEFMKDLLATIQGHFDRTVMPTRGTDENGVLVLI